MAATGDTLAALRRDLHELELKVVTGQARSEERHEAVLLAITQLREDLSEQGKTPNPVERVPSPPPRGTFSLPSPDTLTGYAKALALYVPLLAATWGVLYSAAQSGGSSGATTAVETAVDQGEAVPVATPPTIRVVPVPIPRVVPVPVPALPVEEPPVVNPARDLLPLHPEER